MFILSPSVSVYATEKATVAGGCFWCIEEALEKIAGVQNAISGYAGGDKSNPSYKEVAGGKTKHIETVQIIFDEGKVTYEKVLREFFKNIDPTDERGQFVDRGPHYAPAIFFHSEGQKKIIDKVIAELEKKKIFNGKIKVAVRPYKNFYPAEEYHQDYYKKSPLRYKFYKFNSGRTQYINRIWKGRKESQ
jgi:methionine-S-sulfoxide reductase